MIRLLARIYTQTDYQTSYHSLPKLVLDGWSVSSINRAIEILALSIELLERCFCTITSDWCFALTIDHFSELTEILITYDLLPTLTIEINTSDFYFWHKRLSIFSDLSRSIRHQEIFEPQPGNFGWMDCALNFKSLYGLGGRFLKIRDVCQDFDPYFKVHNLTSVHPKSIILGQMTNHDSCGGVSLNLKLAPVPWWISERPHSSLWLKRHVITLFFCRVCCSVSNFLLFLPCQEGKHKLPVALQADSHNT